MRLTTFEVKAIKQTFRDVFRDGDIYLFGSRVDDTKKGGDIDLFIVLKEKLSLTKLMKLKSQFRIRLQDIIEEQKIDIITSKDENRSIELEIKKTGIML